MSETPGDPQGSELATALHLHRAGRLAQAAACYRAILAGAPRHAPALHYLGLIALQQGELADADKCLRASLQADAQCAETWNDLGVTLLKSGSVEEAMSCLSRCLQLNAMHADALRNMALALRGQFRFREASQLLGRLAALRPASAEIRALEAEALFHAGELHRAADAYREALWHDPGHGAARIGLGEVCEALGRFGQARFQYECVLRRFPQHPVALAHALKLRDGGTPERVSEAEQLIGSPAVTRADRIALQVGLASHYDRSGLHDRAFTTLKSARDAQFEARPFDLAGFDAAIDGLLEVFDVDFFARARSSGVEDRRLILIVGMPRSGTTLTEQILASHSQVAGGGEMAGLPRASYRVLELSERGEPYPRGLRHISTAALRTLADDYLAELTQVDPSRARTTDKLPFNFMHLATLALMLPRARIIHCRREPLDNCVSCYFTDFAEEIRFTSDLYTLGRYFAGYARLMKHWHKVLPLPVHELRYEALVRDTQHCVRELLDFCGLPWEQACMDFHRTERGVRTPSRWQVRQPIYAGSVGRWRQYAAHLAPLVEGLGTALDRSTLN